MSKESSMTALEYTELELTRTPSREYWRGMPVAAYQWTIHDPEHPIEGLRERTGIAYHWSTGPKDAEPLIRVRDASTAIAELQSKVRTQALEFLALDGQATELQAQVEAMRIENARLREGVRQIGVALAFETRTPKIGEIWDRIANAIRIVLSLQPKDQSNG
jgi:hypothetical protein